jgi:hypothetical protein
LAFKDSSAYYSKGKSFSEFSERLIKGTERG